MGCDPYVLGFEPILIEKVWGGRRLERYGKRLDAHKTYGESWELSDLGETSKSGAGGAAARSVVVGGAFDGRLIGEVVSEWGAELLGQSAWDGVCARAEARGTAPAFPLLLKFLDAREHLSVQVHPSPSFAAQHAWANLKTESWLVLEADEATLPSGRVERPTIFTGLERGVDASSFAAAIEDGSVVGQLGRCEAMPGACHTLPSGLVHALGGGVLVLEVQTPSDTTFRVYDWAAEYGRSGRELHVDEAIACVDFEPGVGGQVSPGAERSPVGFGRGAGSAEVASTERYGIGVVSCGSGGMALAGLDLPGAGCRAVVGLSGSGRLVADGAASELAAGRTLLVPACASDVFVEAVGDEPLDVAVIEVR
ncbi:MAG: class I mannose-6-phosphate isomerase [Planctomycetota bacterium]